MGAGLPAELPRRRLQKPVDPLDHADRCEARSPRNYRDRLNKPTIALQITLAISAKPEIGFGVGAGADGGTLAGDGCTVGPGAGDVRAAPGCSCANFSFKHLAN